MHSAPRQPDTWHLAVRGLAHMLAVPQGFTLSVTGTFAITLGHRGFPGPVVIWLFIATAGLGFCGITLICGAQREAPGRPVSIAGLAMMNLLPAVVVPAGLHRIVVDHRQDSLVSRGRRMHQRVLPRRAGSVPRPPAPQDKGCPPWRIRATPPQEEQDAQACASS